MPDRATTAQRNLLEVLLEKRGLIARGRATDAHTGPQWRPVFRTSYTPEPEHAFGWPSITYLKEGS
jgi:hypothetical protein